MTSTPDVTTDNPRTQDALTTAPEHRHASTGAVSNVPNRYSIGSNETGESSTAASRRSVASSNGSLGGKMATERESSAEAGDAQIDGRGSHRSHRNRNSGGFLLSNSAFSASSKSAGDRDPLHTPHRRQPSREEKGKSSTRSREKSHTKRRSNTGLGLGVRSSPLASIVTTAEAENGEASETSDKKSEQPQAGGIDVDSTQIVNLALNLSESRRSASRRSVSATSPPVGAGLRESFAGGSLRQHLQQQRRSPRTSSPKAGRSERALSGSYRNISDQKPHSLLQPPYDPEHGEDYQYAFSASTLARAEKAKSYIGLMAEYRRLLEYVPPLKPNGPEKAAPFDSPHSSRIMSPRTEDTAPNGLPTLGREYNLLQYIRNRKVRARERKAIDGEAQGFGDLTKVSSWVHDVAAAAIHEVAATTSTPHEHRTAERFAMPPFSKAAEVAASPHTPPQSKSTTATPKIKRPRIDWVANPADLLADVFWLEQDDNKSIIEDHSGRKMFAGAADLRRPVSHREEGLEQQKTVELARVGSPNLRLDTQLPDFTHITSDTVRHRERATSRAKQKLREVTRLHHGHNGSVRERQILKGRLLSDTDTSDSEGGHRLRRRSRRATAETLEPATDILEKQMMEMLANESTGQGSRVPAESDQRDLSNAGDESVLSPDGSRTHTRSTSLATDALQQQISMQKIPSGRPSLEGPVPNTRTSFEELDSTAPNSPQTKAIKAGNAFVPSIAMDLSPPPLTMSPSKHHIARVRSRINPFEHTRSHSRGRGDTIETPVSAPVPTSNGVLERRDTSHQRKRSLSPVSQVSTRKTDDSTKAAGRLNQRRGKGGDESSGIIGFLKGSRGPVAKVGELLWKKEPPQNLSVPPGLSSDESDTEILRVMRRGADSDKRDTSTEPDGINDALAVKPTYSRNEALPVFTSSHASRTRVANEDGNAVLDPAYERQTPTESRKATQGNFLAIPQRTDVQSQSPSSSPELEPVRRYSSVSDLESRRGSALSGVENADARLNAILGRSGHPGTNLPVTGLTPLNSTETAPKRRPTLEGKREWSISDRELPGHRGPVTKREIARVRALLLASGIKAKEITRHAAEMVDLQDPQKTPYSDIAKLSQEKLPPVTNSQQHIIAARILASDMQLSSRMWQASADNFYNTTVSRLFDRADKLHSTIADNLTPKVRTASDEADAVSRNILTFQSLQIKRTIDTMDNMMRRRRRRFRWLRRGGWVLVEWALVGVMWFAWFLVVFVRIILGVGSGAVRSTRWLFWL